MAVNFCKPILYYYIWTVIEEDKKKNIIIRHLTDPNQFKHVLTTFNDKLNAEEIEDMFDEFEYDDDKMILTKSIVRYNIAQKLFILYHKCKVVFVTACN